MTADAILARLAAIRAARAPVGYDIEGNTYVSCQAFAESPTRAFCIVTDQLGAATTAIWGAVIGVLEDPLVPKWVWNAHHEVAVLKLAHGITLRGWEDGMALWFERQPELPKGLKYAASVALRGACWTEGIEFDDDEDGNVTGRGEAFYRYNMHDAAKTLELALTCELSWTEGQRVRSCRFADVPAMAVTPTAPPFVARYALRKRLVEALTWSSLRGIRYDKQLGERLRAELEPRLWAAQAEVDAHAGVTLPATPDELLAVAARRWCHAVKLRRYLLPGQAAPIVSIPAIEEPACICGHLQTAHDEGEACDLCDCARFRAQKVRKVKVRPPPEPLTWKAARDIAKLGGADALTAIQRCFDAHEHGQLADLLGLSVNVKSTPQVIALLDRLKLPKVYRRGERGEEGARTKDADVLLDLYLRTGHPVTVALLKTIALRTQLQELDRQIDPDGRIRCSFISCGTVTDRTASKKWLTGSGGNLQTVPKEPVNFRLAYVPG